jgi:hypothetical protein
LTPRSSSPANRQRKQRDEHARADPHQNHSHKRTTPRDTPQHDTDPQPINAHTELLTGISTPSTVPGSSYVGSDIKGTPRCRYRDGTSTTLLSPPRRAQRDKGTGQMQAQRATRRADSNLDSYPSRAHSHGDFRASTDSADKKSLTAHRNAPQLTRRNRPHLCKAGVEGSSPFVSTTLNSGKRILNDQS